MSPAWWAVWVAVGALVVGLVTQAIVIAFRFGKHSARLDAVEKACNEANVSGTLLASLTATVHAIKEQLGNLDQTIRDMLMHRTRGRGRAGDSDQN